jgi:hypothetical protein
MKTRLQRFHALSERTGNLEPDVRLALAKLDEVTQVGELIKSGKLTQKQQDDMFSMLRLSADHPDIVVPFKDLFHPNAKPEAVEMYKNLLKQATADSAATTPAGKDGFEYEAKVTPEIQRALAANDGSVLPEGWVFVPASHNSPADGIGIDGVLINTRSNPPQMVPVDFALNRGKLAEKILDGKGRWALHVPEADLGDPAKVLGHLKSFVEGKTHQPAQVIAEMQAYLSQLRTGDPRYAAADVNRAVNHLRTWLAPQVDAATAARLAGMDEATLLATAEKVFKDGPVLANGTAAARAGFPLTDFPQGAGAVDGANKPFWPSFRAILTKEEADALGTLTTAKEVDELIKQLDKKLADSTLSREMRDVYSQLRQRAADSLNWRKYEGKVGDSVSGDLGRAVDVHVNNTKGTGSDALAGTGTMGRNRFNDPYIEFDKTIPINGSESVTKIRVYENGLVVGVGPPKRNGDEMLIEIGNIRDLLTRNKRGILGKDADDALQAMLKKLPREGPMFDLRGSDPAKVLRDNEALRLLAAACGDPALSTKATGSLNAYQALQEVKAAVAQSKLPAMSDPDMRRFVADLVEARQQLKDSSLTPLQVKDLADLRAKHPGSWQETQVLQKLNGDAKFAGMSEVDRAALSKKVAQLQSERPSLKLHESADIAKRLGADWDARGEFLDILNAEKGAKIPAVANDADRIQLARDLRAARDVTTGGADRNVTPARLLELRAIKNDPKMPPGFTWKEADQIKELRKRLTSIGSNLDAYNVLATRKALSSLDEADAHSLVKAIGRDTPAADFAKALPELQALAAIDGTLTPAQLAEAQKLIARIEKEASDYDIATTKDLVYKAAAWMVKNGKKDPFDAADAIQKGTIK